MEEKTLSEGSKLEIIDHLRGGNKHTYYSVISDIIDASTFDIAAPIEKGIIIPLEIGKEYECIFITIYGLFRCQVVMEKRYVENNLHFLRMKVITQIAKYQRRGFYRLDVVFDFRYYNQLTNRWKEATTLDISGNGIRCISNEDLSKGTRVLCELKLEIEKKVYTISNLAEVIDSTVVNLADRRYETRWVFVDIPMNKQDIIIKFIYDEQRRRLKRESR